MRISISVVRGQTTLVAAICLEWGNHPSGIFTVGATGKFDGLRDGAGSGAGENKRACLHETDWRTRKSKSF